MPQTRDWLSTLWRGSYKGVPFWFQSSDEEGGRGLVIHEFPHRDDPFVEDLGEAPRRYGGTVYVASDQADRDATRLIEAALATKGPGTLVDLIRGPVQVHCETFKRTQERDRLGFISFDVRFVRDGARTAIVSIGLSANQAFQAADRLAGALADLYPLVAMTLGAADHVVAAAVDGIRQTAAAVESLRQTTPATDAAAGRATEAAAAALYDAAPVLLSRRPVAAAAIEAYATAAGVTARPSAAGTLAAGMAALVRDFADALAPDAAAAAMRELADALVPPPPGRLLSPTARDAATNQAAALRAGRLAALTAFCEATLRRTYTDRPAGVTARAEVAERLERELGEAGGADNAALYVAIEDLRGRTVEYLTRLIADLAPVVTVSAARTMPALWWAWRLYQDPARDAELTARNRVPHPAFMPTEFQALAR